MARDSYFSHEKAPRASARCEHRRRPTGGMLSTNRFKGPGVHLLRIAPHLAMTVNVNKTW